jgi:hypothetical protein
MSGGYEAATAAVSHGNRCANTIRTFFVSHASKALLWPWVGRLTRAIAAAAGSRWMPHAGRKTAADAGRLDGQPASADESC